MWHAHNFYPEFLYRNGKKVKLEGNKTTLVDGLNPWAHEPEGTGVASEKSQYVHDLFDAEGLEFIAAHKDTSFFLYCVRLSFNSYYIFRHKKAKD